VVLQNFSFSKARNHSIDLATNDWLVWMDADDYLLPQFQDDLKDLVNLPKGVGGVTMGCFGSQTPYNPGEKQSITPFPTFGPFGNRRACGSLAWSMSRYNRNWRQHYLQS
jgi:glycosyltransferase involved in cell wall biosynthesis